MKREPTIANQADTLGHEARNRYAVQSGDAGCFQSPKQAHGVVSKKVLFFTLFQTGPSIIVFKTIRMVDKFAFHASQRRHTISAKIMRRGRK